MTHPDAVPADTAADGPSSPGRARAALDVALRISGGVVAVALAAATAVVEICYAPLRVGGVLVGLSVLVAVAVNYWLLGYTVAVTGSGRAAVLPPLVWMALMLIAANGRTEGDILLPDGNWVALVTIFAGSLSFAVAGYRLLLGQSPATSSL